MTWLNTYSRIIAVDALTIATPGHLPTVMGLAAKDLVTGQIWRLDNYTLSQAETPPFPTGDDTLIVVYEGAEQMGAFLSLGWSPPENLIDTYAEMRCISNGKIDRETRSKTLKHHEITTLKDAMEGLNLCSVKAYTRDYTRKQIRCNQMMIQSAVTACENGVDCLEVLMEQLNGFMTKQALFRGEYAKALAKVEQAGIPIDVSTWNRIGGNRKALKMDLMRKYDPHQEVFCQKRMTLDMKLFKAYLKKHDIQWDRHDNGDLKLDRRTFETYAKHYPQLQKFYDLKKLLQLLSSKGLAVGSDGRNRVNLRPYGSTSGRNQPSSNEFIFGCAKAIRSLIKPEPGTALAYIDYGQQEFGIAAALSGDQGMIDDYKSPDPYLGFAIRAGKVPQGAKRKDFEKKRSAFKTTCLAVQYAMGAKGLSQQLDIDIYEATKLLELHRKTYPTFWKWSDASVDYATLHGSLHTVYGWYRWVNSTDNTRSLRNFPMQANGAEILRVALCFANQEGINVIAPVHDACLLQSPIDKIDDDVEKMKSIMARASKIVLGGLELKTDVDVIRYPDRYRDEGAYIKWNEIIETLETIEARSHGTSTGNLHGNLSQRHTHTAGGPMAA
jgi:hypothetical protein